MKFSPLGGSNVSDEGSWFYSITLGAEDAESSSSTQQTCSSTQEEVRPSLLRRLQAPPPPGAPVKSRHFYCQSASGENAAKTAKCK